MTTNPTAMPQRRPRWVREIELRAMQCRERAHGGAVLNAEQLAQLDRDIYVETVNALGYDPLASTS